MQLHQMNDNLVLPQRPFSAEPTLKVTERTGEVKKIEPVYENAKSLQCSTCGKVKVLSPLSDIKVLYLLRLLTIYICQVCTAQSALSNHMRTHKPKRFKCNHCGRLFGLLIRLAAHKMSHDKQAEVSPIMSSVEQEEELNAEREAKEAREARTRVNKRSFSEVCPYYIFHLSNSCIRIYVMGN